MPLVHRRVLVKTNPYLEMDRYDGLLFRFFSTTAKEFSKEEILFFETLPVESHNTQTNGDEQKFNQSH